MTLLTEKLTYCEKALESTNPKLVQTIRQVKLEISKLQDELARSKNAVYKAEVMLNSTLIKLNKSNSLNRALRRKDLANKS